MGPSSPYSFTLFDHATGSGWNSSTYQSLGAPALWVNAEAFAQFGIAPGQMSLHPGPDFYSPALLRFTAPTAGTYQYMPQLFAGDSGDMNAGLFKSSGAVTL